MLTCAVLVHAVQDVEDLLARAMEKRTVGCTQLNEQSSRSHAVFTLRIEGVNDSSKLKVRVSSVRPLIVCSAVPGYVALYWHAHSPAIEGPGGELYSTERLRHAAQVDGVR